MIQFLDGPAAMVGNNLLLKRAPLYLWVVQAAFSGVWDALDQLVDTPKPREKIYVYRRDGPVATVRIWSSGRGANGLFAACRYVFVDPQPDDENMRYTDRWRDWCRTAQTQEKDRARSAT